MSSRTRQFKLQSYSYRSTGATATAPPVAGERPPPVAAKRRRGVTWTGTKPRHLSASFYSTHMGGGVGGTGAPQWQGTMGARGQKPEKGSKSTVVTVMGGPASLGRATRTSAYAYHTGSSSNRRRWPTGTAPGGRAIQDTGVRDRPGSARGTRR